jgi:fimbrial chaperone protein
MQSLGGISVFKGNRLVYKAVLFLAVFFLPSLASAGSFKVVPIRMFIEGGQKSAVFTVTNEADEKVTIQIGVKGWTQDENGSDIYQPSDDLIVFPKIFTIEKKGGEQIVRVAFRSQAAPKENIERPYRFFFEELPVKKPGETALMFALNLSVPVFIKPIQETPGVVLEKTEFTEGALRARVKNSGTSHLMVGKMKVSGRGAADKELFTKEATGWYVLAGASRVFPIPIPKKECVQLQKVTVSIEVDKSTLIGEAPVDHHTQCVEDAKPAEGAKAPPPSKEGKGEAEKPVQGIETTPLPAAPADKATGEKPPAPAEKAKGEK